MSGAQASKRRSLEAATHHAPFGKLTNMFLKQAKMRARKGKRKRKAENTHTRVAPVLAPAAPRGCPSAAPSGRAWREHAHDERVRR